MEALVNKHGITVRQLKELVMNLPEVDESGEEYGVWVNGTNCDYGLSNPCKSILQLNGGDIIMGIF
jgi:hypothetical protein